MRTLMNPSLSPSLSLSPSSVPSRAQSPAPSPAPARRGRTLTRVSAFGLATATALALAACGGGSSGTKASSPPPSTAGGSFPGNKPSSAPTSQAGFDPAAGPIIDAAQLPKTCNGLVTDADMQLALGNPLNGGDYFQAFLPTAAKQTGRVKCQYGIVQDGTGKVTGDQVEVQLATYADADTAKSHVASTVGNFAATGAQYAPISAAGHPATYVTETGKDAVLVMYDGNRTFLITVEEALVKGDDAKAFVVKVAEALYKHTTPASGANSGGTPTGGASDSSAQPGTSGSSAPPSPATSS